MRLGAESRSGCDFGKRVVGVAQKRLHQRKALPRYLVPYRTVHIGPESLVEYIAADAKRVGDLRGAKGL